MKNLLKYFQLSFLFLSIVMFIHVDAIAQVGEEQYILEDCGRPNPCAFQAIGKTKMPIPCNCIPKLQDLSNIKILIKSARGEQVSAKIVTQDGRDYAATDTRFGGRVTFDAPSSLATLQFGVVNRTLLNNSLKVVITVITQDANGNVVRKEFSVAVGE